MRQRHDNAHPVFQGILNTIAPEIKEEVDPFSELSRLYRSAMDKNSILLRGYDAMIKKLQQPGNISKKELSDIIANHLSAFTKS
jgi:hypothetical protein